MRYNIKKNWISTFEILSKNSVIFTPFILIAFLECLALEISYFCARFPLAAIFAPIIRKFFGEQFLHYPGNLVLLPKSFYYCQVAIYVLASAFLAAAAVQIFINIKTGHPVILKAIFKNTAKRYMSFVGFALIYMILMTLLEKGETFVLLKAARVISRHLFTISPQLYSVVSTVILFITFAIVQAFIILTIPIIVIEKKKLFRAILGSLSVACRNFIKVFSLVLVPLLFYLPTIFMKTFLTQIMDKTFSESGFYITLLGIISSLFIDCIVLVSLTQFLLDTKEVK